MNPFLTYEEKKSGATGTQDEKKKSLYEVLGRIWGAISFRRPILGEIMEKHGKKTLREYAQDFLDVNPSPRLDDRKPELIDEVRAMTEERLGKDMADRIAKQLSRRALVSTADHHSPLCHPFWINANIITGIPLFEEKEKDHDAIIVFSFAGVSMNNASGFPRGILFHGDDHGNGPIIRLPIFPDKQKMSTVIAMRPFTQEDLQRAKHMIDEKIKNKDVTEKRGKEVQDIIDRYFYPDEVLSSPDYDTQVTKINHRFWADFFHDENGVKGDIPPLLYIEIETLVTRLLLKHHMKESVSLISRALFDASFAPRILQGFNNISGAFSLEKKWGTYLFWGIDPHGHRVKLSYKDQRIASEDGAISISLTPKDIEAALKEKKIFPGMFLCYLTVSLYYGMKCLGGFCQVHDLTMTKLAWMQLLKDCGDEEESLSLDRLQTKELGGDGMVLAYVRTSQGSLVPATGIDLLLEKTDMRFAKFAELSRHLTLNEAMQSLLPEMYTVLYSEEDRDPYLASIKPEEIFHAGGVEEKLASL